MLKAPAVGRRFFRASFLGVLGRPPRQAGAGTSSRASRSAKRRQASTVSTVQEPFLLSSLLSSKDKACRLERKAEGSLLGLPQLGDEAEGGRPSCWRPTSRTAGSGTPSARGGSSAPASACAGPTWTRAGRHGPGRPASRRRARHYERRPLPRPPFHFFAFAGL